MKSQKTDAFGASSSRSSSSTYWMYSQSTRHSISVKASPSARVTTTAGIAPAETDCHVIGRPIPGSIMSRSSTMRLIGFVVCGVEPGSAEAARRSWSGMHSDAANGLGSKLPPTSTSTCDSTTGSKTSGRFQQIRAEPHVQNCARRLALLVNAPA